MLEKWLSRAPVSARMEIKLRLFYPVHTQVLGVEFSVTVRIVGLVPIAAEHCCIFTTKCRYVWSTYFVCVVDLETKLSFKPPSKCWILLVIMSQSMSSVLHKHSWCNSIDFANYWWQMTFQSWLRWLWRERKVDNRK